MGKQKEAVTLEDQNKNTAMRVSVVSIVWNVVLSLFKLIAGIVGHSGAMISDAVHSASDVFSTFVVILGVNIASRQSDEDSTSMGMTDWSVLGAAIILAVVLFATGIGIGIGGVNKILGRDFGNTEIPGMIALAAAVVSIGIKRAILWYTRAAAKKINSGALMADAWHHRSDALSSVGAFVGILGARMGFPVFTHWPVWLSVFLLQRLRMIFLKMPLIKWWISPVTRKQNGPCGK